MIYNVFFEKEGDNSMTTGERIKQLRAEKGLSQEKFALFIDMDRKSIF